MKYAFPAVFTKDKEDENVINVCFPDLLGVLTFGVGREEAVLMAKDVLRESLLCADYLRRVTPTPIEQMVNKFDDVEIVEVEI